MDKKYRCYEYVVDYSVRACSNDIGDGIKRLSNKKMEVRIKFYGYDYHCNYH